MCKLVALTAGLVWTAACAGQAPPSRGEKAAATTGTVAAAPQPGDTAFVELQRVSRTNRHTVDGGCHYEGTAVGNRPHIPEGAFYVERVVASDPQTCATVIAMGYRLQMPPLDTAGSASRTLSTSIKVPDSTKPTERRKP